MSDVISTGSVGNLHDVVDVGPLEAAVEELERLGRDPRSAFNRMPDDALSGLLSDERGLYSFCTESIEDYLSHLDVKGKRCLTVAASGDQAIALLMAGASEVVMFDVVGAAGEIAEMKMQALSKLDWDDRYDFARHLWDKVFSPRGFARLCDRVPHATFKRPWSTATQAVTGLAIGGADAILKRHQIFGFSAYLASDEAFAVAQSATRDAIANGKVSFVRADVRELPTFGLGNFDIIVLSNIVRAVFGGRREPTVIGSSDKRVGLTLASSDVEVYAKSLVDQIVWPVAEMLRPNGKMMASYHYGCEPIQSPRPDCRYCGDPIKKCTCDKTDPFAETATRRAIFEPNPGYSVEEHGWPTVNRGLSGEDVAVFITRSA